VSGFGGGGGPLGGDKALRMPLMETLRLAWADPELRARVLFVLAMFGVFVLGIHVPVPIPGVSAEKVKAAIESSSFIGLADIFGGGALRRVSIFALGLNPYITSSIIMQILTTAIPAWKKELQEGGEYARRQQNRRTRLLTIGLCVFQGLGLLTLLQSPGVGAIPADTSLVTKAIVVTFWTAGAMFILWIGEQISEKGIGNGVSLMIFAGIVLSMPSQVGTISNQLFEGLIQWWQVALLAAIFLATTWLIVMFSTAQRRIPIQHMRRQVGMRTMGGQTSYLPLSVNMAGVIPIIFAVSLLFIPAQLAQGMPNTPVGDFLGVIADWLRPGLFTVKGLVACLLYTGLIFFFTYFYTAVQYNVEDISNNLKRGGSFVPGVRPGKQTKDFLDAVISKITVVGAAFLAFVALIQYVAWDVTGIQGVSIIGGTSLLIMVSVALETMRQIEANLLMKRYGQ
jgi:preprotein translocase subunit SecY